MQSWTVQGGFSQDTGVEGCVGGGGGGSWRQNTILSNFHSEIVVFIIPVSSANFNDICGVNVLGYF